MSRNLGLVYWIAFVRFQDSWALRPNSAIGGQEGSYRGCSRWWPSLRWRYNVACSVPTEEGTAGPTTEKSTD